LIEYGRFNLKIDSFGSSQKISIFVSISSFGRKAEEYPIQMNSYVMQPKAKKELFVFAEIQEGQYPVLDAFVWVEIYRPAGSGIETFLIELLRLYDDGQYGDLNANDGIYTAVYSEFLSQVRNTWQQNEIVYIQGKYKMRFFSTSINPVDNEKQTQVIARVNRKGFIGGNSTTSGTHFINNNNRQRRDTDSGEGEEDPRNFPRVERMWAMDKASIIQQERFNRHCEFKIYQTTNYTFQTISTWVYLRKGCSTRR